MIGLAYTMQVIKYSMDIFEQAKPQFQKINYINQTLKESNSLGNNCLIYLIYLFIRTFNDWATIPYALKRPLLRMILKSHLKRFFKTSLQLHVYILMEFFFYCCQFTSNILFMDFQLFTCPFFNDMVDSLPQHSCPFCCCKERLISCFFIFYNFMSVIQRTFYTSMPVAAMVLLYSP